MIEKIEIKNFKSILNDNISLGRLNVFIGENGVGKSNILEALLFASIANTYNTIDADLLYNNGFRVCKLSLLLSSFKGKIQSTSIDINIDSNDGCIDSSISPEDIDSITSKWKRNIIPKLPINEEGNDFVSFSEKEKIEQLEKLKKLNKQLNNLIEPLDIKQFQKLNEQFAKLLNQGKLDQLSKFEQTDKSFKALS